MYPIDQKTKHRLDNIIREILHVVSEKVQIAMVPHVGEQKLFDAALRVLRNAGIVMFDWNPVDKDNKPIIGAVLITLTTQGLLQVLENKFEDGKDANIDRA